MLRPTSQRVRCDTKRVTVARGAAVARQTCRSTRSRIVRVRVGRAGGAWHGILAPISRLLAPPYRFYSLDWRGVRRWTLAPVADTGVTMFGGATPECMLAWAGACMCAGRSERVGAMPAQPPSSRGEMHARLRASVSPLSSRVWSPGMSLAWIACQVSGSVGGL